MLSDGVFATPSSRYYDDRDYQLAPLIVANLPGQQDTLVFGPQSFARHHQRFIDALYRNANELASGATFRAFEIDGWRCVAVLFSTDVKDEGGRRGTTLTLGVAGAKSISSGALLTAYLRTLFATLNRAFSINLPQSGAEEFLHLLRESEPAQDFSQRIAAVQEALLLASFAARDASRSGSRWFPGFLKRLRRRRVVPSTVLYPPDAPAADVFAAFVHEVTTQFGIVDATASWGPSAQRTRFVELVPSPISLADVLDVVIRRHGGRPYLSLFRKNK